MNAIEGAHAGPSSILEFQDVGKTYVLGRSGDTVRALVDVSLSIGSGEFVTVVGPSGCGKSTLLKIAAGLVQVSEGRVKLKGDQHDSPSRSIGVMFQAPVLLPWRTVRSNVHLPAEIFGIKSAEMDRSVASVLEMVGLRDFTDAYPNQLSGGMQQRAALARVLTYSPEVLLMDEPFGALDEFTREAMNVEVAKVSRDLGVTVMFITHNIPEAVFLGDRVVVMSPRPGRISGVVEVPFQHPRTIDVMRESEFTELTFRVRELLGQ